MNLLTVKVVEQALEIMGQGMLGIFSVLVIIALFVWLLSAIDKKKKKKKN